LKKEAKPLVISTRRAAALTCNNQKFFGSFFKKELLFFLPFRARPPRGIRQSQRRLV
jgi:hypothetical protein